MNDQTKAFLDLPTPQINIIGSVNLDVYEYVRESLGYLTMKGSPDVNLVIDSTGGISSYGRDIYDLLRLYSGKVTGLVVAKGNSAASVILQACNVRKAARHADILIHNPSDSFRLEELTNKVRLAKAIKRLRESQRLNVEIYRLRCGKSVREIVRQLNLNKVMKVDEALEFGLIDEIV